MKTIITLLFLFVMAQSNLTSAAETIPKELDILCITEFPTTSFIGQTEAGKFNVRLVNSNGVKYMPIHSGLVTIEDLKNLQEQADVLKNLEEITEFSFDLSQCLIFTDGTFRCAEGSTFTGLNGVKFEAYSLRSSFSKTYFNDLEYDQTQIDATFMVEGKPYYMMMSYSQEECGIAHTLK